MTVQRKREEKCISKRKRFKIWVVRVAALVNKGYHVTPSLWPPHKSVTEPRMDPFLWRCKRFSGECFTGLSSVFNEPSSWHLVTSFVSNSVVPLFSFSNRMWNLVNLLRFLSLPQRRSRTLGLKPHPRERGPALDLSQVFKSLFSNAEPVTMFDYFGLN